VPAGKIWLLLYGIINIANDATAVTRNWTVQVDGGSGSRRKMMWLENWDTTASQDRDCTLAHEGSETTTNDAQVRWDSPIILKAGDRILLTQVNGQAGDKVTYSLFGMEIDG